MQPNRYSVQRRWLAHDSWHAVMDSGLFIFKEMHSGNFFHSTTLPFLAKIKIEKDFVKLFLWMRDEKFQIFSSIR